jgi:uncharacterized membrane protein YkoI
MRNYIKVFLLVFYFLSTIAVGADAISLDEATKKVVAEFKSKVLGAKTEAETAEGKAVHVIKILTEDGRVQHLKVDVSTGNIIK